MMNSDSFQDYCDPLIDEMKRVPPRKRLPLIVDGMRQMLALYEAGQIDPGNIGRFMERVDDVVNINMTPWIQPGDPYPKLSAAGWDIREGDSDEADEAGVAEIRTILRNCSDEVQ